MLFDCRPKVLHKHCLQFLLGVKMAPRETENNAYAKFWDDKQRTLWYVMVFLEWSIRNWHIESWKPGKGKSNPFSPRDCRTWRTRSVLIVTKVKRRGYLKKSEDPKTTTRERRPPKKEKEDPCKLT